MRLRRAEFPARVTGATRSFDAMGKNGNAAFSSHMREVPAFSSVFQSHCFGTPGADPLATAGI